jgi:hypothetical protein
MNIEELQAALRIVTKAQNGGFTLDEEIQYKAVMVLVEAARMWLNPNIEAVAILICELVFGEDWDREIPLVQFNEAKRYVAAALTPGDTE